MATNPRGKDSEVFQVNTPKRVGELIRELARDAGVSPVDYIRHGFREYLRLTRPDDFKRLKQIESEHYEQLRQKLKAARAIGVEKQAKHGKETVTKAMRKFADTVRSDPKYSKSQSGAQHEKPPPKARPDADRSSTPHK